MKKVLYILRYELITTLSRPSFLLVTIGLPLLGLLIFAIITVFKSPSADTQATDNKPSETNELDIEGYIDLSGLIQSLPPDLPADNLIAYPDEVGAKEALTAGNIAAYYIIPEDYLDTGEIIYVIPDYTPFSDDRQDWKIRWSLLFNMTGDVEQASYIWHPMNVQTTDLSAESGAATSGGEDCTTPGYTCESNTLVRMLPLMMLILYYVFIAAGAGMMLKNVSTEKQNRTIESLMLSVDSRQLLTGKIAGLGIVSILQIMLWSTSVFIILRLGGETLNLPPGFNIPTSILLWGLVFFILGYVIYASLMAGLGAMVPDMKAATQASFLVLMPLLVGYFISVMPPVQDNPHGLLATVLSLIPFTAPVVMMLRLTVGGVPTWQLLLSVGILIATVILTIRAVAGMFRAQTLLSGQPFSARRYLLALVGRS